MLALTAGIIAGLLVLGGWMHSARRLRSAANDADLSLAVEVARRATASRRTAIDEVIERKHKLENRATTPALGSAVVSAVALAFTNPLSDSDAHSHAWQLSVSALVLSLMVAAICRLQVARLIGRTIETYLGPHD
ncbi:hypothetical protein [Williamsia sterculiae]|uniref:Uncharacterized protein n=1 Tax=Williamsia sterculiae TaxID=1344003 RepID=A0A1N7CLT9_9NOCA|nr:hypothetical protein [Williamsia sterculiae]SIR64374.1 hypothetical protein SAMN05445060_0211 [Williamsia sterculiae]